MGSEEFEEADNDERPLTRVRISRGFYLGKYEVTQAEWEAVMGSNPSRFTECGPNCPVEKVSWDDVQEFIRRLNATVGEERYRLPTEAEWEYAARAGTIGDRYGNVDAIAWYHGQQRGPHASGGAEGAECVGALRHAGERVGVDAGLVRRLSGRFGDGPAGSRVRLEAGDSGR